MTVRRDTAGAATHSYTTYVANTWTGGLLTQQDQDAYKDGDATTSNATSADAAAQDSKQSYSYAWWDGALQSGISNDHDDDTSTAAWTTRYTFDASGHVTSAVIAGGRARTIGYTTDQAGMIIDRDEAESLSGGDPRELHYHFGGMQLGQVGNNGTDNLNYTVSIQHRLAPGATSGGAFTGGVTNATPFADFDQSYDAINGSNTAQTSSSYTITGGETLMTVAQAVWGDATL